MSDPRCEKLADILVNYSTEIKPGEWVVILAEDLSAESLVNDIVEKALLAGGHPTAVFTSEPIAETILQVSSEEQLKWLSPFLKLVGKEADVAITVWAARNTRSKSGIDPARVRIQRQAMGEFLDNFYARMSSGEMRWVGTQFPCQAFAQDAEMSLRDYEDFVYAATYADQDDPIGEWKRIQAEQERLVEWLKGKKEVVVRSPSADLRLSIAGRTFINSCGKQNMPCGEIFTSPVEDSANGWIEFSFPAINMGREVEGIRLEFQDGKVVGATAQKNQEYLLELLEMDEGARYLGEFAIGTNYAIQRFTKSILFDEKIGGTLHLAVGRGFPQVGGQNKSTLHWDMICDMRRDSQILVDGELFYKDGQFQV